MWMGDSVNDTQRKAAAAGFLHALRQSPDTFSTWLKTAKDDHEAIGGLVQQTLGLAQKPSKDDLVQMSQHIGTELKDQVEKVQALDANVPRSVGNIIFMQQDS